MRKISAWVVQVRAHTRALFMSEALYIIDYKPVISDTMEEVMDSIRIRFSTLISEAKSHNKRS
jgi:hypothetical protein